MFTDKLRTLRTSIPTSLILGHATVDTYMNLLSGLLPVLTVAYGLSYLLAGILAMIANLSSSLVQPALGRWFDRTNATWIMEAGIVVNCIGMSLIGISPNYVILMALVAITGFGHAAFHPPAYSTVMKLTSSSKGGATGIFLAAGNTGWFVGPILAGGLISLYGLWSTILLLPFGLIVAALTYKTLVIPKETSASITQGGRSATNKRHLSLLATIASLRSVATQSVIAFLPIYLIASGHTLFLSTALTSLWLAVAVLGQICGGYVSDRVGRRVVIAASLLIGSALFCGFLVTSGLLSMILLVFSGAFLYGSWSVIVVMSSEVASGNTGSVAGLMLGFTIGVGGVAAAIFGAVADALGLTTAFYLAIAFPIAGGLLALLLPKQIGEIRAMKQT